MTILEDRLEALESRQQITDQIYRYCRAIDRRDGPLLRSVFHPDSTHRHGPFEGRSSDFCDFALTLLDSAGACQHHIGNILIEFDGERAYTEAYWIAYMRLRAGVPGLGVYQGHDVGIDEDCLIGGRYLDRFERRDGLWRIAHRTGLHDWQRFDQADERGGMAALGERGAGRNAPFDAVYHMKAG